MLHWLLKAADAEPTVVPARITSLPGMHQKQQAAGVDFQR